MFDFQEQNEALEESNTSFESVETVDNESDTCTLDYIVEDDVESFWSDNENDVVDFDACNTNIRVTQRCDYPGSGTGAVPNVPLSGPSRIQRIVYGSTLAPEDNHAQEDCVVFDFEENTFEYSEEMALLFEDEDYEYTYLDSSLENSIYMVQDAEDVESCRIQDDF